MVPGARPAGGSGLAFAQEAYLAVRDVLRGCAWRPGTDLDGRPASIRAVISFQLGSRWPISPWVN